MTNLTSQTYVHYILDKVNTIQSFVLARVQDGARAPATRLPAKLVRQIRHKADVIAAHQQLTGRIIRAKSCIVYNFLILVNMNCIFRNDKNEHLTPMYSNVIAQYITCIRNKNIKCILSNPLTKNEVSRV